MIRGFEEFGCPLSGGERGGGGEGEGRGRGGLRRVGGGGGGGTRAGFARLMAGRMTGALRRNLRGAASLPLLASTTVVEAASR